MANKPPKAGSSRLRTIIIWGALGSLFILGYYLFVFRPRRTPEIPYSEFRQRLDKLSSATISERQITGEFLAEETVPTVRQEQVTTKRFKVRIPFDDQKLVEELLVLGVNVSSQNRVQWVSILLSIAPWVLIIGFWFMIMRQSQAGASKAFQFGKSKVRISTETRPDVTFDDVAGIEEAKEELEEIIEFLRSPRKFSRLGGRIPKGVLLVGAPGTGKTLLARAVAGEASVPFLSISGSDFVELFVGVGASRVRDLFEQGKRHAPCIIFIDEIDAVGRQRGAGLGGGHDEREQTLNQLLVEMDGFETSAGIIFMAATNRPDILDPALLRPGRFDRKVILPQPDVRGREGILKIKVQRIPLSGDVDLSVLARGTPGFTGADLENMVNEAALLAARRNRSEVTAQDFEDAKDKVLMGAERRSLLLSAEEKRRTAYHEAGHALVSRMIPGMDPIHKVTIIPRGMALGVTQPLPIDERKIYPKEFCEAQIAFMLGGRAAEENVFGDLSTGAANDLEKTTILARKMVCEWGMSTKLGPLTFGKVEAEIFLGREMGMHRNYSEKTAQLIDSEIRAIIEGQHKRAQRIIEKNVKKLRALADALIKQETLNSMQVDKILGLTKGAKRKTGSAKVKKTPKATQTSNKKVPSSRSAKAGSGPRKS
ncbi:cell division protein FtsH [candidate division TA06 bacterium B3_TA06]|uniref:ATP-dependent zinc metalloprotease FtsH n=1 Tax=candidate division TA06 bacterium B3_TA06 TaxID=2012487 RepID=A0A532V0V1_UNCT6|nr:MAG: cell division protein FtsH [candidate division TA06 bacterium B3_TA06]